MLVHENVVEYVFVLLRKVVQTVIISIEKKNQSNSLVKYSVSTEKRVLVLYFYSTSTTCKYYTSTYHYVGDFLSVFFFSASVPGDGANDVSMIQVADVGIGISGQEGMQVRYSCGTVVLMLSKHLA